jgi:Helix-turn-helix domain
MSEPTSSTEALDLIWGVGVGAIAAELNLSKRSTYYLLESKDIPARKHGGKWVASRPALRRYFAEFLKGATAA